ncbi:nucleoside-diphosphate-sugar epimerase [Streptosporangium becharense]|uniref:Nucleoside-diphosphate-sugar epimerase n=1 Tax=Streptosporangium becharense TaxID=1816182 RepID=A0A7W9IBW6_9ACTN|nr:NAD(P)-dependent oxidoreductase [Streptosporangium becharense]MBB2914256.1 nucleoside-diphosphate-sugar epimerase [Streptosporangium becharense]MBB5817283.1 nucleoside-diphosphate-sugar epimerase [Streptosporangium becharense]
MHIVLLGGAGYLGTAATRHLTALGHHVTAVDGLIYQRDDDPHRLLPTVTNFVHADLRDPAALRRAMTGADAVVHLGGLVGEPACAVDERLAVELNYASPVIAAEAVATAGIAHYVLFSSCSVYGSRDGTVDEDTAPNPLGIYARTKILAEQRLGTLLEGRADLTVLRLATVHGRSPRQRLDSVVNRMTAQAVATGRIPLNGGSQRRPLVHVTDVAEILAAVLNTPAGQRTFNVGSDRENFTIAEIAETVERMVPGSRIDRGLERDEADARDYRTSFARLAAAFPGSCPTRLRDGVREIAEAVTAKELGDPDLPEYDNYRGLVASRDAGHISVLRSAACERLHAEYMSADWSAQ